MWCIPKITNTFIKRMNDILDLYARKYDPKEPVIGIDEKTVQLLDHLHAPLQLKKDQGVRIDYQYKREGTANIFLAVQPKGGKRITKVTTKKKRADYFTFLQDVVAKYPRAKKIHIVADNFGTHSEKKLREMASSDEVFSKIVFHFTPVHASWLNVAELEIGVLERQCLKGQRFVYEDNLRAHVKAWERPRNKAHVKIKWKFTKKKAKKTFKLGDV